MFCDKQCALARPSNFRGSFQWQNQVCFREPAGHPLCAGESEAAEPPKPGLQQAILKKMEGTWDTTMKMGGTESKGTATYKMDLGGLWLASTLEGSIGGQKFLAAVSTPTTRPKGNTSPFGWTACPRRP